MSEQDAVRKLRVSIQLLATNTSWLNGMAYLPRAEDVFIVTSPKCGTTILQQVTQATQSRGTAAKGICSRVSPVHNSYLVVPAQCI
jgi:hypothetical protein